MLLKFFLHTFKGVFLLLFLIPIYAYRPIIFFGIVPSFFHTNTKKVSNVLAVLCNIDSFTAKWTRKHAPSHKAEFKSHMIPFLQWRNVIARGGGYIVLPPITVTGHLITATQRKRGKDMYVKVSDVLNGVCEWMHNCEWMNEWMTEPLNRRSYSKQCPAVLANIDVGPKITITIYMKYSTDGATTCLV